MNQQIRDGYSDIDRFEPPTERKVHEFVDAVEKFHSTFNIPIRLKPDVIDLKESLLRISLIQEELNEYTQAVVTGDIVEMADALTDLLYVVVGSFVQHGFPLGSLFNEVQRSNMTKVGGSVNSVGKYVKPDSYSPPNILAVLRTAGYGGNPVKKSYGTEKYGVKQKGESS